MGLPASKLAVIALLILHALQFAAYPEAMNLRTSVAVTAFLLMATFAPRYGANRYAVAMLQFLGIAVALVVMLILHISAD